MLQHAAPWAHDENAGGITTSRPHADKENVSSGFGTDGGNAKPGPLGPLKLQGSAGRSARRTPLGNITNSNTGQENTPAETKRKASTGMQPLTNIRRPLGDITNSAAGARPTQGSVKPVTSKPPFSAGPKALPSTRPKPAVPSPKPEDALTARAEALAREGVERLAGKGWAEMEADRKAEEDARIEARVRGLSTPLASWHRHPAAVMMEVAAASSSLSHPADGDDMDVSPEMVVKPPSFAGPSSKRSGDGLGVFDDFASASLVGGTAGGGEAAGVGAPWSVPQLLDVLSSPSVDCPSLSELLDNSEEEDLLL